MLHRDPAGPKVSAAHLGRKNGRLGADGFVALNPVGHVQIGRGEAAWLGASDRGEESVAAME